MNVVIAIDSFKGSLTSIEAGNAVKSAALKAYESCEVCVSPLADGGEGTVNALFEGLGGEMVSVSVMGPLRSNVMAQYCILPDKKTAVMEIASAAGITLIEKDRLNPLYTTTFGVGEMILDAILRGCRDFIIGIGGSATNDGGIGMLSALGYEFLDANGKEVQHCAAGLKDIVCISDKRVVPQLSQCRFRIACDVDNVLCGETGCSKVFSLQKGATAEMAEEMDKWMLHYGTQVERVRKNADMNACGAGAAGGLGFAFLSFTQAYLSSGVKLILSETGLEEKIKTADLVITGEGRLDSQTAMGKAPIGVARLAKKYNKKVIAFSGCIGDGAEILNYEGIDAYFPILRNVVTLNEALNKDNAYKNLSDTAYQVFRII